MPGAISVAFVVPCLDRPDFALRCVRYYKQFDLPITIYVGDSCKDETNSKNLQRKLLALNAGNIRYYRYVSGSAFETFYHLLDRVEEQYCVYLEDDNYVVPEAAIECANFLANGFEG